MEPKKSPKVDVKNKRTLFFEIGMLVSLGIVFAAFQIESKERTFILLEENLRGDIPPELMPITRREQPKPPEPPKPKVVSVIEIIETGIDFKEDSVDWFAQVDPNSAVAIVPMEEEEIIYDPIDFYKVEEKPEYFGGDNALLKFLGTNTNYPRSAVDNGIEGRVYVAFVIGKSGEVSKVKILRGSDPILDKEAIRVVSSMPNWKPGKQRGKPVEVNFNVPINFKLN
ncbi:MAG: TonB family protein [Salinivirgaceae bacterium]|jgi:protein TonB|nr:TonB family protein [Salinivirgaceae bacterium]